MTSVRQALDSAWKLYQAGQWQQAERLYLQVLEVDPHQLDALNLLAAIVGQTGRDSQAIEYLQSVLRLKPDLAGAHNNLGNVFAKQGKLSEAVACFQKAVRLQPDFAMAHSNLGNALREQGRLAEAVASLQRALHLKPDYAEARNNLELALRAQRRLADARTSLDRAATFKPANTKAHLGLGNALLDQGILGESMAISVHAVRPTPDRADTHFNLGNALLNQGKLAEAVDSYQQATLLRPDCAEVHYNLGIALWRLGRLEEAASSYRRAIHFQPDHADAYHNLGVVLKQQGKLSDAKDSLQQAIRLKPDHAGAYVNLGNVLKAQGWLDAAITAYRDALKLKPELSAAQNNLGNVFKDLGRLDAAIAAYRTAFELSADAGIHSNLVYLLSFHPGYDAQTIHHECLRWNQLHAEPLTRQLQPHGNNCDFDRRLRIGYVSPNFYDHVVSTFTIPLFSHHDRRECEIFCYADVLRPDALTERTRGYADVWRNTVSLSDQQLADLVRSDRIDILVDLTMHMARNRLLVFARKPAPIQVAWLAYPGTTGLSTMDYRLTDPYLDPPGLFDDCYSEESIRLPDTFWCYDPRTDEPPVNELPALKKGLVTFGCLNNFCKINDGCLVLWARVLQSVPQSRLLLLAPQGQVRERVLARFQEEGIAAGRLEFAERRPRLDYLKLYQQIDLGLDPLPSNGHTTSLDAFWMGVPTLTLVGKTVVGRAGWSQLCNLGLKELAAQTPEQYVAIATRLAGELSWLQELRSTLRQRMLSSPLMDANRFARNMEQAYRQVWRRWCRDAVDLNSPRY